MAVSELLVGHGGDDTDPALAALSHAELEEAVEALGSPGSPEAKVAQEAEAVERHLTFIRRQDVGSWPGPQPDADSRSSARSASGILRIA